MFRVGILIFVSLWFVVGFIEIKFISFMNRNRKKKCWKQSENNMSIMSPDTFPIHFNLLTSFTNTKVTRNLLFHFPVLRSFTQTVYKLFLLFHKIEDLMKIIYYYYCLYVPIHISRVCFQFYYYFLKQTSCCFTRFCATLLSYRFT